jgi:HK97 family phage major capsid protein
MEMLTALNEELEQNIARRTTLREKNPGAVMPEDSRTEFETLTKRGEKIVQEIEKEKQRLADADTDRHKAYLDEPVHHVPHPINSDDGEEKSLQRIGWELKGGMWHAPISTGKSVPMYPNEVLFGPLPEEASSAQYVKQTRAIIQPEYREAWIKWYRAAPQGQAMALAMLSSAEQKALSEGSDGAGGFTVPPDIQAEIGGRRDQTSIMRRLATVRTTVRDRWIQPMVAPNSTAATRNIYADDFVAAWVGETPSQSSIDVVFQQFEIGIKKLRAYTLLSNDLIADSVGNLISDLSSRGGRSIALKEDQAFIAGPTGASPALEPTGILSHSLALTVVASAGMAYDVEGTTSNTISNTVADPGSAPKIKQLVYQLPSQYAANASWIMRRSIQGAIAGLVDANGRPFWNSYLDSGFARPQMLIEGFPVENSEFVGADGSVSTTPATTPLIFGDISAYYIIDRAQISVRVLTERFGDTDQTGLFLFVRVGGGLWNYDAIRTGVIAA